MINLLLKFKIMFLLIILNKVYIIINIIISKFKLNVMIGYVRVY